MYVWHSEEGPERAVEDLRFPRTDRYNQRGHHERAGNRDRQY